MQKTIILGLAIFGALCGGGLGAKWVSDASKYKAVLAQAKELGIAPEAVAQAGALTTAGYLLMLGAAVAVAAGVVNWKVRGWEIVCGAVLIGCALVPALFAMKSLIFTFFLVIAGGLCLYGAFATRATAKPRMAGAY